MNNYTAPKSSKRHEVLQYVDMAWYMGKMILDRSVQWVKSSGGKKVGMVTLAVASSAGAAYALNGVGGPSASSKEISQAPTKVVAVQPGEGWDGVIESVNPNISAQNLYEVGKLEQQKYGSLKTGEYVLVPVISGAGQNGPSTSVAPVKHSK